MAAPTITPERFAIGVQITEIRDGVRQTSNDPVALDALAHASDCNAKGKDDARDEWLALALGRLQELNERGG